MDTVIQGLSQSALVQKLSETEHNAKRFLHDVPDNAPIRSFSKEEVLPYMGNNDDATQGDLHFLVPRRGYLNRMYLRLNIKTLNTAVRDNGDPKDYLLGTKARGPDYFASFVDSVTLAVGGKVIETLYPESILFEAFKENGPASENLLYGMYGFHNEYGESELGPLSFDLLRADADIQQPDHSNFLIPLNFSLFKFHKDAVDTNFLQNIEVVFKRRKYDLLQSSGGGEDYNRASLVCKYHTVHNHFRTQIRNANFQRDTTSLITCDSSRLHAVPEITQVASTPDFPAYGRYEYSVKLDAFVSDILISFKKIAPTDIDFQQGIMHPTPSITGHLRIVLKAHDQILFDKQGWEMEHADLNVSQFDIQDRSISQNSKKFYGVIDFPFEEFVQDDINLPKGYVDASHKSGNTLYRIPLGLFSTDEFLSGGLNFNNLADVRLIIEGEGLRPEVSPSDFLGLEPVIIFRTKSITRIDGKTGAVAV